MNKLVKRTLAFLLVVCTLFGMMAMSVVADETDTETTTVEPVVYDFTALSQLGTGDDLPEPMWYMTSNSSYYYGFGGTYLNVTNNKATDPNTGEAVPGSVYNTYNWVNRWYNNGVISVEGVDDFEKNLNWMVVATKNTKSSFEYNFDAVQIGGYAQGYEAANGTGTAADRYPWNGIAYDSRSTADAYATGGWMAIKIKSPGVGNFKIDLTHSEDAFGALTGSVYLLPGAVSDVTTINAYLAGESAIDGAIKLSDSVSYYDSNVAANHANDYISEIRDGATHSNKTVNGIVTELGTVNLTDVHAEYTVIFTADSSKRSDNRCRVMPEKLTFTDLGETVEATGDSMVFQTNGGAVGLENLKSDKIATTGTSMTDSTGGYKIFDADTTDSFTVTYGENKTTSLKLKANYTYLRYYNYANATKLSTCYYIKNYNAEAKTAEADIGTFTNYNAMNFLNSKYDDIGWKLLGSTDTNSRFQLNGGYIYAYDITGSEYVALKIKATQTGKFAVDLGLRHAGTANAAAQVRHMGLKLHILEDDGTITGSDDLKITSSNIDFATRTPDAYYWPNYTTDSVHKNANNFDASLVTAGGSDFTYDFVADEEYIVVLQRWDDKTYSSATTVDGTSYSSTNNMWVRNITCTPVADAVATINLGYGDPADETLTFDRNQNDIIATYKKVVTDGYYTDGTTDGSLGGCVIANKDTQNVTVGEANYTLKANQQYWQLKNSSGTTVYAYKKSGDTYVIPGTDEGFVNIPLANALNGMYDTLGWEILGTKKPAVVSFADYTVDSVKHGYLNVATGRASKTDANYLAVKVKSPGAGTYNVDLGLFVANAYEHQNLNIYIVETTADMTYSADWASVKPDAPVAYYDSGNTYETKGYRAMLADLISYETGRGFTYDFEADSHYIIYIECKYDGTDSSRTQANIYPSYIQFSSALTAETDKPTLAGALAAASAGDVVSLKKDLLVNSVVVPDGVTLDLNGHTLTAGYVSVLGAIKDSSDGSTGLLNVLADRLTYINTDAPEMLPIYDAVYTGYRFYTYNYNAYGCDDDVQYKGGLEGAKRFWYQLTFADTAAYDLIATKNSGVSFGVNVYQNEDLIQECIFSNSENSADKDSWAAEYANFAKGTATPWLWFRVQNAAAVGNFEVAPVITAGGQDFVLGAMAYTAPAADAE